MSSGEKARERAGVGSQPVGHCASSMVNSNVPGALRTMQYWGHQLTFLEGLTTRSEALCEASGDAKAVRWIISQAVQCIATVKG